MSDDANDVRRVYLTRMEAQELAKLVTAALGKIEAKVGGRSTRRYLLLHGVSESLRQPEEL